LGDEKVQFDDTYSNAPQVSEWFVLTLTARQEDLAASVKPPDAESGLLGIDPGRVCGSSGKKNGRYEVEAPAGRPRKIGTALITKHLDMLENVRPFHV
jgi:hypothetical protein